VPFRFTGTLNNVVVNLGEAALTPEEQKQFDEQEGANELIGLNVSPPQTISENSRLWTSGRHNGQPFPYRIMSGLPVTRPESLASTNGTSKGRFRQWPASLAGWQDPE
jgi:hypothetical protein